MSEISIATPVSDGDVLSWPITSTIIAATTNLTNLVRLPHTKAGQWPIAYPLAPDQQVEGNMWGIFKINGSWVAGTIDWLRPGQFEKTLDPTEYGPGFKTIYESYTGPKLGETVGYFVSTLARFGTRTSNERSNIVWLAYGTSNVVPSPYLRPEVQDKIAEFTNKFPLPSTTEESQQWTHSLCQQLKFSYPNEGWGHKSAGPGRPHSADCICLSSPFIGWDIITNAGSPQAKLNLGAESIDLSGQIFEQVIAYDLLGSSIPVPPPTNGTIEEKLDLIIMMLHEQMEAIIAPRVTRMG